MVAHASIVIIFIRDKGCSTCKFFIPSNNNMFYFSAVSYIAISYDITYEVNIMEPF